MEMRDSASLFSKWCGEVDEISRVEGYMCSKCSLVQPGTSETELNLKRAVASQPCRASVGP